MKKIIEKVIPEIKQHIKEEEQFFCDICGKKLYTHRVCCLCQRDICDDHRQNDRDDFGDYPDYYCPICYNLKFVKYDKELDDIESESIRLKELVIEKIKKESLSNTIKTK